LATGLFRRRVIASRGLLAGLPADLLAAVVAHEEAHSVRRDGLRRALAGVLSVAHLPATRRAVLADLDLAIEQACDDEAGLRVGDRLTVARALLAVRRLGQTRPCPAALGALSIGGSSLDARVAALVEEPAAPSPRSWRRLTWALACLLGAALAADTMHHLAESTLGLLTR
jgi:Zn-dependent protease with chaperone function